METTGKTAASFMQPPFSVRSILCSTSLVGGRGGKTAPDQDSCIIRLPEIVETLVVSWRYAHCARFLASTREGA
jgi:hypothetical protein